MEQLPLEALAYEIAQTLNDPEALPLYKTYIEKYDHQFLRDTLKKVMSIPSHKIRRTRGALFTFLVQHNGRNKQREDKVWHNGRWEEDHNGNQPRHEGHRNSDTE